MEDIDVVRRAYSMVVEHLDDHVQAGELPPWEASAMAIGVAAVLSVRHGVDVETVADWFDADDGAMQGLIRHTIDIERSVSGLRDWIQNASATLANELPLVHALH